MADSGSIVGTNVYLSVQFDYIPAQGVSTENDHDDSIDEQPQQSLEIVKNDTGTATPFQHIVPIFISD